MRVLEKKIIINNRKNSHREVHYRRRKNLRKIMEIIFRPAKYTF